MWIKCIFRVIIIILHHWYQWLHLHNYLLCNIPKCLAVIQFSLDGPVVVYLVLLRVYVWLIPRTLLALWGRGFAVGSSLWWWRRQCWGEAPSLECCLLPTQGCGRSAAVLRVEPRAPPAPCACLRSLLRAVPPRAAAPSSAAPRPHAGTRASPCSWLHSHDSSTYAVSAWASGSLLWTNHAGASSALAPTETWAHCPTTRERSLHTLSLPTKRWDHNSWINNAHWFWKTSKTRRTQIFVKLQPHKDISDKEINHLYWKTYSDRDMCITFTCRALLALLSDVMVAFVLCVYF